MENYEALGRYVSAKEQAEKFAKEREKAMQELVREINRSIGSSTNVMSYLYDFDAQTVRETVDKIAEINQNLLTAIKEVNLQAELCGKPKISISKPYRD